MLQALVKGSGSEERKKNARAGEMSRCGLITVKKMSRKDESAEINSQHVPLRQTAEATGRGKGLEAVWDT
jgi:hypothetical protein